MSDLTALNRIVNLSSAANDFLVYTNALMAGRFQPAEALSYAPGASHNKMNEILAKCGVVAGSTTDSYWGETVVGYREINSGFSASLVALSAGDRILAAGAFFRVPLKTRISFASSAATGSAVSELAAKPISRMTFTLAMLEPTKAVAAIVVGDELARSIREFVADNQARVEAEYEIELIDSGAGPDVIAAKLARLHAEHAELRECAITRACAIMARGSGAMAQ